MEQGTTKPGERKVFHLRTDEKKLLQLLRDITKEGDGVYTVAIDKAEGIYRRVIFSNAKRQVEL